MPWIGPLSLWTTTNFIKASVLLGASFDSLVPWVSLAVFVSSIVNWSLGFLPASGFSAGASLDAELGGSEALAACVSAVGGDSAGGFAPPQAARVSARTG